MSTWVVAICERPIAGLIPKDLLLGIEARLATLTDFLEPEEPEDTDEVLHRLTVGPWDPNDPASSWHVRYRDDRPPIVMLERVSGQACAAHVAEELAEGAIRRKRGAAARRIREVLGRAHEQFPFCLKASHLDSMGFPIAVAAAAYLVQRAGGGLIRSCSTSWMEPDGLGVRILLEYEE
jgi:hypothetical protein